MEGSISEPNPFIHLYLYLPMCISFLTHAGSPVIASASPSMLSVHSGGSLLLTCVASSTIPVTYKWLKEGKTIPDDSMWPQIMYGQQVKVAMVMLVTTKTKGHICYRGNCP